MAWLWSFAGNTLVLFVAFYVVVETGHYHLYDERPKHAGLRVLAAALILAALLTALPISFDTMFTTRIHYTLVHGIAWFLVFMFVLLFHPSHALLLGIPTLLLVPGLAFMAIESLTTTRHQPLRDIRKPSKAYRAPMSTGPVPVPSPADEPAK